MVALLAGGSTNCLLDTGPINKPPTVKIADTSQPLHRGSPPATFTATVSDPDQSLSTLDVTCYEGTDCDHATVPLPVNLAGEDEIQCSYTPTDLTPGCVVVVAKDRYGATAKDSSTFTVANRPPTAVITRTSPTSTAATFPLLSSFAFDASGSTDPDPGDKDNLTFSWTVTQPDQTKILASTSTCSFTAQNPGTYHVQLIATDPNQGVSAPVSLDVVIAQDQPPCIAGFTPTSLQTVASADQTTTFAVIRVDDDADPYPGSTLGTFTWWYRNGTSGDFSRLSNPYNSNRLDFGADVFVIGDLIQIRVEYQDRVNRDLSSCDQNAERCELVAGCAQWVTWTVSFLL